MANLFEMPAIGHMTRWGINKSNGIKLARQLVVSFMVGLAAHDLEGAVYLLKQDDAGKIVRQRNLAE